MYYSIVQNPSSQTDRQITDFVHVDSRGAVSISGCGSFFRLGRNPANKEYRKYSMSLRGR